MEGQTATYIAAEGYVGQHKRFEPKLVSPKDEILESDDKIDGLEAKSAAKKNEKFKGTVADLDVRLAGRESRCGEHALSRHHDADAVGNTARVAEQHAVLREKLKDAKLGETEMRAAKDDVHIEKDEAYLAEKDTKLVLIDR